LSGAQRYLALDALPHARTDRNLRIFDELVELFRARAPIPDDAEFPDVHPKLADYSFPADVLTDDVLSWALSPHRVDRMRRDVRDLAGSVSYRPTWYDEEVSADEAVDLVVSQAVLEHVDALEDTYRAMFRWLRPGGVISHQIDFKCHATAERWNGHLAYSDLSWRLMRGKLPYFINRRLPADHLAAAASAGFSSVSLVRVLRDDGLPVAQLASRFRGVSELDAKSAGGFLQAMRPRQAA
jgi:hypothetical protein